MKLLKFKNALYAVLYFACFASCCLLFVCIFGIIVTYIVGDFKELFLSIFIGLVGMPSIWLIAVFVILLNRTVVISAEEIKMCRGKKIIWIIKREEIQECIYNAMKWYEFLFPVSAINGFALQFKLKEKGISRKFCSLSQREIKKSLMFLIIL